MLQGPKRIHSVHLPYLFRGRFSLARKTSQSTFVIGSIQIVNISTTVSRLPVIPMKQLTPCHRKDRTFFYIYIILREYQ